MTSSVRSHASNSKPVFFLKTKVVSQYPHGRSVSLSLSTHAHTRAQRASHLFVNASRNIEANEINGCLKIFRPGQSIGEGGSGGGSSPLYCSIETQIAH